MRWPCCGSSTACRSIWRCRWRIGVGALVGLFNGLLVTWLKHPLLHRHARQLQSALRRLAVDHAYLDLQPGLSAAGRRKFRRASSISSPGSRPAIGSHPISLEVLWMLVLAVVVGLLAPPLAVRLPADGDRRQPGRRHARPPAGRRATRSSPSCSAACSPRSPAFSTSPSSRPTQPNIGLSFTFPVFAAVIIGGASLAGGKGTVIGTMCRRAAPGRTAAGAGAAHARARTSSSSSSAS